MEMQTGLDDLRIVENEERAFWQIFWKVAENILVNAAVTPSQQKL